MWRKIKKMLGIESKEEVKAAEAIKKSIEKDFFEKQQRAEIHRIEFEKWIEGEKIRKDPGDEYVYK